MSYGFRYSRWDNSQAHLVPNLDELFDVLSDEILQYGDVSRAMRQLLQRGFSSSSGQHLDGVQDLLRQLRQQRQDLLGRSNIDSLYEDLRQRLDDIVHRERESIERRLRQPRETPEAQPSEAKALQDVFERMARKNLDTLDALPESLPEAIQQLKDYEFLDPEAAGDFQELLQMLQRSTLDSFFQDMTQRLQQLAPEDLQQIREMTQALNRMLAQRLRGEQPDFDGFMQRFGHIFGPDPSRSLDELVQRLQQQMGQMQSLLNSLSPDQREALLDLLSSQFFDGDLQRELADLAANLDMLSPSGIAGRNYPFFGDEAVTLAEAMDLMGQLEGLEELERQLDRTRFSSELGDVDQALLERLLGQDAAERLEELKRLAKLLEEAGYVERRRNELRLTPRAIRKIGQRALRDIFQRMRKATMGNHPTQLQGMGQEPSDETKSYEFGDPFVLDLQKTVGNALRRNGPGVPVRLSPGDFEVHHTEYLTSTATVLVLDLSRSMPMRGNFVAAKKVALALNALIRAQFPRDMLYLVGFSGFARKVEDEELPHLNVGEFGRGTNIQAALQVSRQLLARHRGSQRQVILVTDGEPTAFFEANGYMAIEYPPGPRVLRETLREVRRCTREGITINTFMLEQSYHLKTFVTQLAKANKGRVLFTSPEQLGRYIMVDYVGRKGRHASG